eukprot:ctg_282.g110
MACKSCGLGWPVLVYTAAAVTRWSGAANELGQRLHSVVGDLHALGVGDLSQPWHHVLGAQRREAKSHAPRLYRRDDLVGVVAHDTETSVGGVLFHHPPQRRLRHRRHGIGLVQHDQLDRWPGGEDAARRGESLDLLAHHVDAALVGRVQLQHHGRHVLAVHFPRTRQDGRRLAGARRAVEQKVRQGAVGQHAAQRGDDLSVRYQVVQSLRTVFFQPERVGRARQRRGGGDERRLSGRVWHLHGISGTRCVIARSGGTGGVHGDARAVGAAARAEQLATPPGGASIGRGRPSVALAIEASTLLLSSSKTGWHPSGTLTLLPLSPNAITASAARFLYRAVEGGLGECLFLQTAGVVPARPRRFYSGSGICPRGVCCGRLSHRRLLRIHRVGAPLQSAVCGSVQRCGVAGRGRAAAAFRRGAGLPAAAAPSTGAADLAIGLRLRVRCLDAAATASLRVRLRGLGRHLRRPPRLPLRQRRHRLRARAGPGYVCGAASAARAPATAPARGVSGTRRAIRHMASERSGMGAWRRRVVVQRVPQRFRGGGRSGHLVCQTLDRSARSAATRAPAAKPPGGRAERAGVGPTAPLHVRHRQVLAAARNTVGFPKTETEWRVGIADSGGYVFECFKWDVPDDFNLLASLPSLRPVDRSTDRRRRTGEPPPRARALIGSGMCAQIAENGLRWRRVGRGGVDGRGDGFCGGCKRTGTTWNGRQGRGGRLLREHRCGGVYVLWWTALARMGVGDDERGAAVSAVGIRWAFSLEGTLAGTERFTILALGSLARTTPPLPTASVNVRGAPHCCDASQSGTPTKADTNASGGPKVGQGTNRWGAERHGAAGTRARRRRVGAGRTAAASAHCTGAGVGFPVAARVAAGGGGHMGHQLRHGQVHRRRRLAGCLRRRFCALRHRRPGHAAVHHTRADTALAVVIRVGGDGESGTSQCLQQRETERVAAAANGTTATLTSSRDTRAGRAEFLGRAFLLGTIVFAGYFSQAVGLIETDANKSAFLCSLTVVLVPFLEWTLFRKRVQLRMWASAALAVLGVGLLELDETTMTTVYDVWSFMQAVFFGAGFMMVESLTRDYPGRPLQVASINLTVVALYSAAWYAVSSLMGGSGVDWGDIVRQVAENGPAVAGALLYTGLVTTATAVILQTIAISRVSAEETSVIFCLEPLFAVAFTAALLGESMSLKGGVGGALILAAVLINQALNPEFQQRFRQLRHSEKEQAETQESRDAVGSVNGHEQQRRR